MGFINKKELIEWAYENIGFDGIPIEDVERLIDGAN